MRRANQPAEIRIEGNLADRFVRVRAGAVIDQQQHAGEGLDQKAHQGQPAPIIPRRVPVFRHGLLEGELLDLRDIEPLVHPGIDLLNERFHTVAFLVSRVMTTSFPLMVATSALSGFGGGPAMFAPVCES